MRVFFNNIDGILSIIKALSDSTRLLIIDEILSSGENGITAADLSRKINKKIPSTLHQLEILKSANIIEDKMIYVDTIGREIKHWFVPKERHKILIDLSLSSLSKTNKASYSDRINAIYHFKRTYNPNEPFSTQDIYEISKNIEKFSEGKISDITEEDLYDALAIETFNKFRNANPPSILSNLFNDLNNFSSEVGSQVLEILIKNQRIIEKTDPTGNIHYLFVSF